VQRQSLPDFEVIVYDDGSAIETRASYAGLAEHFGPRFRFVTETPAGSPGQGPSTARNRAISLSRGGLTAFCDDDDEWTAGDHLAVAAAALSQGNDAEVFYADQAPMIDGVAQATTWWSGLDLSTMRRDIVDGVALCFPTAAQMLRAEAFAHLNVTVARRNLVDAIGGFWPRSQYEEDLDFYWRMLDKARGVILRPQVVAWHHVPNKSLQENASTRLAGVEQLMARLAVCLHARSQVRTPEVLAAIRATEGYAYRRLAVHYLKEDRHAAALTSAATAMAVKPGFKWGLYLIWLAVRSAMQPRGRG